MCGPWLKYTTHVNLVGRVFWIQHENETELTLHMIIMEIKSRIYNNISKILLTLLTSQLKKQPNQRMFASWVVFPFIKRVSLQIEIIYMFVNRAEFVSKYPIEINQKCLSSLS